MTLGMGLYPANCIWRETYSVGVRQLVRSPKPNAPATCSTISPFLFYISINLRLVVGILCDMEYIVVHNNYLAQLCLKIHITSIWLDLELVELQYRLQIQIIFFVVKEKDFIFIERMNNLCPTPTSSCV
jgi:hypothetical protein